MAKKAVLAIGVDPVFVDYTALAQFTPEIFGGYIDAQIERVRSARAGGLHLLQHHAR